MSPVLTAYKKGSDSFYSNVCKTLLWTRAGDNSSSKPIYEIKGSIQDHDKLRNPSRELPESFQPVRLAKMFLTICHTRARTDECLHHAGPSGWHDRWETRHEASKNQHLLFCKVCLKCLKPQKKQIDFFRSYLKTKLKVTKLNTCLCRDALQCRFSSEKEKLEVKGTVKLLHQVLSVREAGVLQEAQGWRVGVWSHSAWFQCRLCFLLFASLAVASGEPPNFSLCISLYLWKIRMIKEFTTKCWHRDKWLTTVPVSSTVI